MKVLLANQDGTALFTNMDPKCYECARSATRDQTETISCMHDGERRRRRLEVTPGGQLYLCCPNAAVPSKRIFKRVYEAIRSLLPSIEVLRERLDESSRTRSGRLIHNLKTLNAMSTQEFYAIAPQSRLARLSYREQVDELERLIRNDPRSAARAFLRIQKNNIASKCEFGSYEKFNDTNPNLNFQKHDIRRVLLNIFHPFFPDFSDKGIYVETERSTERIRLDYETFQVAVFHLIDNAAKYTAPDTPFDVRLYYERSSFVVSFEMTSLALSESDADRIFADGYSADRSRELGKSGDGIGLGIAKKLLALNDARLLVARDIDPSLRIRHEGQLYARNAFQIWIDGV